MIAAPALRPTRTRYAVLFFVYAAAFITYLDRVCISVAAPAMQADLGLSQIQFAWVFTVFYIAYGVFEIPTAWLGDRWGQRRMLIRIVGCWSLFTIFTGMVRSLATLLITRTVFGAAEAGAFPTLSRALSRWFAVHERSRANGIMWMGARSGGALAPPIAVALMALIGWRYTFAVFGAVGLIWCAVCAIVVSRRSRRSPGCQRRRNCERFASERRRLRKPKRAVPWKTSAASSHDDRAVLQLLRLGIRISVLRHLAADVLHARARLDAAKIRSLRGACRWRPVRWDA